MSTFIEQHTPKVAFTLPKPTPTPAPPVQFVALDEWAQEYDAWCEALVTPIIAKPDEISVNVGLLHLQDGFMTRFAAAPAKAKRFSTRKGHPPGLLDVYLAWYQQLEALRRTINPPLVREPPKPPRPPKPLLPPPPAPVAKLPEKLEKLLENYAIDELLGEET
jgi:hypothetical protein